MKRSFNERARAKIPSLAILLLTLLLSAGTVGQNIDKAEYFLDNDPGFGLGTNIPIPVPSPNITNLQFTIGLGAVSYGFHTLYIRARDVNNRWSLTRMNNFYRLQLNTAALPDITKVEYFMDNDPGFGLGTNVSVTPSPNITSLPFTIGLGAVSDGCHMLYVRAKDGNGRWSLSHVKSFYKLSLGPAILPDITRVEYFIDTDPGTGLGTNVPVTASPNISNLNFTVGLGAVPSGFHMLFVRAKDGNGRWSFCQVKSFYNLAVNNVSLPNVTRVEYFFDNDPGYGQGTSIPVTPSVNITNLHHTIDLTSMAVGFHMLFVRAKDANGRWSMTEIRSFYKAPVYSPVVPQVVKAEYFIDNDPGFGGGTNIPVTPSVNITNLNFTVDLTAVPAGCHMLFVRAKDAGGKWSFSQVKSFYKTDLPASLPNVTKVEYFFDTDPGRGSGINVPVTPSTNINNLSFLVDTGILPAGPHTLWVRAKDANGKWSQVTWATFTQGTLPVSVTIAADNTAVCAGTPVTFTATPFNGGANPSFQWKVNGVNAGTNNPIFTYVPANADSVRCILTSSLVNGTGNPATSNKITMAVNPVLPVSVAIAASANPVCPGTSVTFTATPVNGGTPVYQWKVNGVNAGTNSAQFSYTPVSGDAVTCVVTSNVACATGNPATSNQVVMSVGAPSPTVSGPSSLCAGAAPVTYTTETGNTGYNWTVSAGGQITAGAGTSSISVVWSTAGSQTVSVTYTSGGCVALNPGTMNVTVSAAPAAPGPISGLTGFCVGTQGVSYSVVPVAGATSYQWTLPPGFFIVSGSGTNSVVVNISYTIFTQGTISCRAVNACGQSALSPGLSVASRQLLSGQPVLTNVTVAAGQQVCTAAQSITTAGSGTTYLVQNGGTATLIASQNIRLLPGTAVAPGGHLHGFITGVCESCPALKTAAGSESTIGEESASEAADKSVSGTTVKVFPNPTTGSFRLEIGKRAAVGVVSAELYSSQGVKLISVNLSGESGHTFSLADRPAGVYLLRVITPSGVETIKVIRD